jgi:hypothetical protein
MKTIKAIAGELFEFTVATSPIVTGATVELTALFGIDGVDVGVDDEGDDLVFPMELVEDVDGVYHADLAIGEAGVYWAKISVDGAYSQTVLLRVESVASAHDAQVQLEYVAAVIAPAGYTSMTVSMHYSDLSSAGNDAAGETVSWPQSMTEVPGHSDCFYFDGVYFDDPGRVRLKFTGNSRSFTSVIVVHQDPTAAAYTHRDGFAADAALDPSKWVSISYIRRWCGWSVDAISDATIRELRRLAIETFVQATKVYVVGQVGSWVGLRAQGDRLYLPMPVVLPSGGGSTISVEYHEPTGSQETISEIDTDDLVWRVSGANANMPYVQIENTDWDSARAVKITATWGLVSNGPAEVPLRLQQALVGLIRWHSVSFATDADGARDQSTINRVTSEGNRDVRVTYSDFAIGNGVTGDRTVDRVLAETRVHDAPLAFSPNSRVNW